MRPRPPAGGLVVKRRGSGGPVPDDVTEGDPYQRPDGVTDATVAALGKFSEAYELLIRARGRLYDFHQMMGRVDFMLGDAADLFEQAGHPEWSQRLRVDLVG
ncbi:MAG: hypothetical protein JWL70_2060, partial [Acidimicrobiia bacterium]|nr:hypothetical protein [Acidimicrobiia bacterium]